MGGEEIKILKAKCNELITRLQQKQEELEQLNLEIEQLEAQKCSIEENLTQFEADTTIENAGLNKILSDEEEKTPEAVVQNFNQMMETMQTLSKQLENSQEPEKTVRRRSSKERLLDGIKDAGRKVGKFLLMVAGTVILSLAATILFNENLRDAMWEILKECMG